MPTSISVRRRAAALTRALAGLAGLAVLLVGLPAALWTFGSLPHGLPGPDRVVAALSAPDDGSLLMTTLTLIGWAVWLWVVVPVLVELGAVLARHATPRIPGFATSQRVAAFLIGSVLLASPAATPAPPPRPPGGAPRPGLPAARGRLPVLFLDRPRGNGCRPAGPARLPGHRP